MITPALIDPKRSYPLILSLHSAGSSGYQEPPDNVGGALADAIWVLPADNNFQYAADPYSGNTRYYTGWWGYTDPETNIAHHATEQRVIRYVTLIRDHPVYRVDPARLYVEGASMGGGGTLHLVSHYPTVFASAAAVIGWVDPVSWGAWWDFESHPSVGTSSGPDWWDWQDLAWVIRQTTTALPPIIHTFRKDDQTIDESRYPEVLRQTESKRLSYVAQWQNGGHLSFWLSGAADYLRFRKDEAYPAFSAASNSDDFLRQQGQRNLHLDWSASLHDLIPGSSADELVDTPTSVAMSFKSLTGDATAQVTLRNLQRFVLAPNETVSWTNATQANGQLLESGTAQADAQGLLTLALQITAAGNRLLVTRDSPPQGRAGDLDGDGRVTLGDLLILIRMLVGQVPADLAKGDLDGHGSLGVGDVRVLIQLLVAP